MAPTETPRVYTTRELRIASESYILIVTGEIQTSYGTVIGVYVYLWLFLSIKVAAGVIIWSSGLLFDPHVLFALMLCIDLCTLVFV